MRKLVVIIIALAALEFLAGVASAGKIRLGTHTADEISRTCSKEGGIPTGGSNTYGCAKECGSTICFVECNKSNNQCTGTCPKCGRRERNLPLLGGADAVERTLKNSVERPSKPY